MNNYSAILIIYNPTSSSGKAELRAERLARQLRRRKFSNVVLKESDYSGHTEVLAYEQAVKTDNSLVISVSGDGGYNEAINGVIRAKNDKPHNRTVCALLAAGNANDHKRAVSKRPLIRAIVKGQPGFVDILEIKFGGQTRYAHSYIGIGVTGETVAELNQENLTRWKEIKIVTKNLLNFNQFSIINENGRQRSVDSLVFANIHRMSKVLKINTSTNLHDGLFNFVLMPHKTRFKFLFTLLGIALFGVKNPPQLEKYKFKLTKPQLAQLDGEPMALPANTSITVSIKSTLLRTLR